jgi:hypothetical protein
MPFEKDPQTGKLTFSFTNMMATLTMTGCFIYFYWISVVMTKKEAADNANLQQITIVMITLATLVSNYYFGNSNNAKQQQVTMQEMQKQASTLAATANPTSPAGVEMKVDKAIAIQNLKLELDKLEPESDRAKEILAEIEKLEKLT